MSCYVLSSSLAPREGVLWDNQKDGFSVETLQARSPQDPHPKLNPSDTLGGLHNHQDHIWVFLSFTRILGPILGNLHQASTLKPGGSLGKNVSLAAIET